MTQDRAQRSDDTSDAFGKLHHGLRAFNDRVGLLELWLVSLFMALLLVVNAGAVMSRYLLGYYPPWIIEVSQSILVYIVFLGGAWLYRERQQIAVTVILDALPKDGRARRILELTAELVILAFASVLLYQALAYQPTLWVRETAVLRWPQNLTTLFVPIAYLFIVLACIEHLMDLARRQR